MESHIATIMEAARGLLKAGGYFVDNLWHVDDVHFICEQLQLPSITQEAAMEVFVIANVQFDGETGISWPALEKALHVYLERQRVLSSMVDNCPTDS